MKRIAAIVAVLASIPLLVFGGLFLIAAMTKPERILVAGVLLASGSLVLLWAIVALRRLAEISPEGLAAGTLSLARRLGGEITVAQVQAEYRISAAQARHVLEKLRSAGQARVEEREGRVVYVLPGLQPSKIARRCPYCGSSFPVREALHECPNCGASLELEKS